MTDGVAGTASQLGLLACLSYVIGNVVGSGIFITPGGVLTFTGSIGLDLVIWTVCGLISIIAGIVYIELGTGIPSDGGDFAYAIRVNWQSIAFSFMAISGLITYPGAGAVQATTFGQYLMVGFSPLVNVKANKEWIEWSLGALLLAVCTFMNMFSLSKGASKFQIVALYAKALILFTVVGIGMYHFLFLDEHQNVSTPFAGSKFDIGNLALACYSALWSFAGWDILNYGAPSVKNPRRNLPISLIGGLIAVTTIYVLTNFSFCVVMGAEAMATSTAVAADFAHKTMGSLSYAVPFATAILLLSTVNGNIFANSRILSRAAQEGHLPKFLAATHKKSMSPRAALLAQFFLSLTMTMFKIETIINYVSVVMWAQKAISCLALLYMRHHKMEMHKDVLRVPVPIIIVFLFISSSLAFIPLFTEIQMFSVGFGAVSSLALFFFAFQRIQKPPFVLYINDYMADITCKLLNCEILDDEIMDSSAITHRGSAEIDSLLSH